MAITRNPNTGHLRVDGTEGGNRVVSIRQACEIFSGDQGEKVLSEIAQDFLNRGLRVPLPVKVLRHVKDRETREMTTALNNVEQLRKKRLWTELKTGVITNDEYQKQLREGSVV